MDVPVITTALDTTGTHAFAAARLELEANGVVVRIAGAPERIWGRKRVNREAMGEQIPSRLETLGEAVAAWHHLDSGDEQ